MAEHGVPVDRVINAGGIPQNNAVLNQVYANVLGKPVLVPDGVPTSLGSGIFALLAAGAFVVEEAQEKMCLGNKTYQPELQAVRVYEEFNTCIEGFILLSGSGMEGVWSWGMFCLG